jgi:hypothetical protein
VHVLAWSGLASASAGRAAHGLAQLCRRERARGADAHDGAVHSSVARLHCDDDLTGAREAAGENMAGLTGAWMAVRHELMGIDGGVGWHGEAWTPASGGTVVWRRPTRTMVERVSAAGWHENAVARHTHRRTDGVDGGVSALGHARSGADSGGRWRAW